MKMTEFKSWLKKEYGGSVKIVSDGTDKSSEEGNTYSRLLLISLSNKIFNTKDDFRINITLLNGEWYIKDSDKVKKYINNFVNKALKKILKK